MDVTASHLMGMALMSIGISIMFKGEASVEYGITDGGERPKFIKSKSKQLVGSSARLVGAGIFLLGLATILLFPSEHILFTI